MGSKHIGVTSLTFQGHVTMSRDSLIPHRPFPIDCPLEPRLYLLTVSKIFNRECDAMVRV